MGGESKSRAAEIAKLKERSEEDAVRWRQMNNDMRSVAGGIDLASGDPARSIIMIRALAALLLEAKRSGSVDDAMSFLYATTNASVRAISFDNAVACKKGCSACCHIWVSVSPPEALYIAKIMQHRGLTDRVLAAHEATKDYDFTTRYDHPHPCPLLADNACSIYDDRPKACRVAASSDADACGRSYLNISNEEIPLPAIYDTGRIAHAIILAVSLHHVGLSYHGYEFNSALLRALDTDHAEERWLSGENIFDGLHRDPTDILQSQDAQMLSQSTFSTL